MGHASLNGMLMICGVSHDTDRMRGPDVVTRFSTLKTKSGRELINKYFHFAVWW